MIGKGEAGIVEGSDKIIVTVTELPVILVSAGESISVEGGNGSGVPWIVQSPGRGPRT